MNTIVELLVINPVTRGVCQSVTQSSKTVYVEKVLSKKLTESEKEKQIEDESDEVESEEEELEDIEDSIAEMNILLEN